MFAAVRRRELRSNRQESTLQNEPARHYLRGSGRARSRELPGHPGGHAVESGPAAQDRTRLSRTAPRRPGAPPRIPHRRGNPPDGGCLPMCKTEAFETSLRGVSPTELLLELCFGRPLARPKEQASWLLGFPTSRDRPMTWRVGWARTYVAPSSRALQTRESWDVLVDPGEPWGIRE